MRADVVLLPADLHPVHLERRCVIVFDVLRATTTMTAALDAGAPEIRIYDSTVAALEAARACTTPRLLCGEINTLPPPGFDLGNSPGQFRPEHAGRTIFMSTTNGTRAIVAARAAQRLLIGALVNAAAAARAAASTGLDITLLCAGTQGAVSMEDLLGAGAVLEALDTSTARPEIAGDPARIAQHLFRAERHNLPRTLRETAGGRNIIRAGLEPDIDFCATLNRFNIVGEAAGDPLAIKSQI